MLAISASGQISLFDLATGGRRGSTSRTLGNVGALAWAPSGRYVAAGNSEGRVALVAARGLTYEWLTTSGKKGITVLCVDPEGLFIAAGDVAGGVRVWKARTGERLWELERACAEAVVALAFGPDTLRATGADGGRR